MSERVVDVSRDSERCCAYVGCKTRLSIYNSDFLCWAHADETTRASFDRASARQAVRAEQKA